MKIQGMDAQKVLTNTVQDTNNFSRNTIEETIDKKHLTHMSEFEKRELPVSDKVVVDAIERINKAISGTNRRFDISVHEKTKEIIVKVIDSETNEVVREIPPEKILDMFANIMEMAGLIVDERR